MNKRILLKLQRAVLIAATLATLNLNTSAAENRNGVRHVSAVEAQALLLENSKSTPKVQVLDVRTAKEFEQGHIPGAINIDYYSDDFAEQVKRLDPDKHYLVHCRSGVRSGNSLPILKSADITNLIHLDGGFKAYLSNDSIAE